MSGPGTAGGWIFVRDAIKNAPPKDVPQPGKFRIANALDEQGSPMPATDETASAPVVEA